MNRPALFWLWLVTGSGEWLGVTDTFGQAQQRAETCMRNGGKSAVVESARLVFNPSTMRREYAPTGRRCTASRAGERVQWTQLAWMTGNRCEQAGSSQASE